MNHILEKEELMKLKVLAESDAGKTQRGKKNNNVQYVIISDGSKMHCVVECLDSGNWLYGEQIAQHEVKRYA